MTGAAKQNQSVFGAVTRSPVAPPSGMTMARCLMSDYRARYGTPSSWHTIRSASTALRAWTSRRRRSPSTIVIAIAGTLAQRLYFRTGRCPKRPSLLDVSSYQQGSQFPTRSGQLDDNPVFTSIILACDPTSALATPSFVTARPQLVAPSAPVATSIQIIEVADSSVSYTVTWSSG
jgi:hypothetical protein